MVSQIECDLLVWILFSFSWKLNYSDLIQATGNFIIINVFTSDMFG